MVSNAIYCPICDWHRRTGGSFAWTGSNEIHLAYKYRFIRMRCHFRRKVLVVGFDVIIQ